MGCGDYWHEQRVKDGEERTRLPLTPTVPTNPIDRTVSERTNALDAFWRMTQPVNPCAEVELPFKEEEELSEC